MLSSDRNANLAETAASLALSIYRCKADEQLGWSGATAIFSKLTHTMSEVLGGAGLNRTAGQGFAGLGFSTGQPRR